MLHFPRWKVLAVLAVVLAGVIFALPNVLPKAWQDTLRDYAGLRPMTLGLDLQGGTSVLMEIDGGELTGNLIDQQMGDVRAALRAARIGYKINRTADGVSVAITDAADTDKAYEAVRGLTQPVESELFGAARHVFTVDRSGQRIAFSFDETGLKARLSAATEQALGVLGRRLDGFGIKEVSIQRQGLDRILIQVPGAGLPDEVKRALGLIGALAFQMSCDRQPAAAADIRPEECAAYHHKDEPQEVMWVQTAGSAGIGGNEIAKAETMTDTITNEPAVSFTFSEAGARRFGELTEKNVGKPFAIVLDGQVLSAPRINEPILGGSGRISGNFTPEEANNLVIAMRSGALPARLVYIDPANESAGSAEAKRSDL